jgi:hypothetical protein
VNVRLVMRKIALSMAKKSWRKTALQMADD